ncbi:MAG: DUF58 domain-containing protein [Candidatus Krumholzibacteriota bacterium]|nr:DUF58 domain-containing protein [Candidatus Krumholzibacteriota bacterium]
MSPEQNDISEFLRPETVSRLANIDLKARLIVEGFIAGLHKSPYHGFSVEFAEYRQYNAGESTRNIDWKIYAKTDRYYTKIFEDETNLSATLLLDRSASMDFGSSGITKLRYGTLLSAALAYLMIKQRDAVGLAVFDEKIVEMVPHRSVKRHLFHLMKTLENITPGAMTEISNTLHEIAERIKRRGLIILISDLLDDSGRVISGLKHFRHRGHEIVIFHLLDPKEISLDYGGEVRFVDSETGEKIRTQPWFLKKEYSADISGWINDLETACKENAIDYNLVTIDTSFDKALFSYLSKRRRMR